MNKKIFQLYNKKVLCLLLIALGAIINTYMVLFSARLLAAMVDMAIEHGIIRAFQVNGMELGLLVLLGSANYLLEYMKTMLLERERYYAMHKIFCAIMKIPYDIVYRQGTANYFNMISSDLELAVGLFREVDALANQFAKSLGAIIFVFALDRRIGNTLIIFGIIIVCYNFFISPKFGLIQQQIQTDDCAVRSIVLQEYSSNEYKHFYDFGILGIKYENAYSNFVRNILKKAKWRAITSIFDYMVGFLQTYLPLLLVGLLIKDYSLGNVLVLITNVSLFMGIFRSLGRMLISIREAFAGAERIVPFIHQNEYEVTGNIELQGFQNLVEMKDLKYYYNDQVLGVAVEETAWDISGNIGIVGNKGSGKSTVIKILAGLLKEYIGSITINKNEIREINMDKSNCFAYLSQDFPVFDMTILENFELMAPGKSEGEYMKYAALVNMDKEIQEMPEGIHTSINSDRISTGQRQRLSICMVLLRDMPFVILDEPVSNLDIANVKTISRLFRILDSTNFIVVSHDMQVFDNSFKIYEM